jgi:predicted ester cyclase
MPIAEGKIKPAAMRSRPAAARWRAVCSAVLLLGAAPAAPPAQAAPSGPSAQPAPPARITPSAPPAPSADVLKQNKAVVRRYLVDVLGGAHPEAVTQLVAKSYRDRTPGAPEERGPAAVRNAVAKIHELFSKVDYLVQELIAEDDRVVARYLVQATPRLKNGALPVPPVIVNGITIFKLAGGRIEETWIMNDQLNMLRQLGFAVSPAPAGPGAPAPGSPASPPAGSPPSRQPALPTPAETGAPPD